MKRGLIALLAGIILCVSFAQARGDDPVFRTRYIFPSEKKHNHASCLVETQDGELLAAWYSGTGERKADDVVLQGAWLPRGADWRPRFLMADTPGYPDCNPALFAAPDGKIWLFWPTILDHEWESALLKFAVVTRPKSSSGPVTWEQSGIIHLTPGPDFPSVVNQSVSMLSEEEKRRYRRELDTFATRSRNLLHQRLGWMPRVHPVVLPSGRYLLPLYTDTFSMSLMAISDDHGKTWSTGHAMAGFGSIQPSVVRKEDGTLVAFMRDNGPHHKIRLSTSTDDGRSWSSVSDSNFPNPGAGVEAIRLRNGHWVLIYNDLPKNRHSLAVSLSVDEGKNWGWTRHVERSEDGQGSFHYPSIIQARDGLIHATYTHSRPGQGSSIAHVTFIEDWIKGHRAKP